MSTDTGMPEISFSGSKQAQEVASRAFAIMRARGMFMSDNAPIRALKDELASFLQQTDGVTAEDVDAAISGNPEVFTVTTNAEGAEVVMTTRLGRAPIADVDDTTHTLSQRLMTPEPMPEKPPAPVRERVRVDPSWATLSVSDLEGIEDDEEYEEEEELALSEPLEDEVVATPSATAVEPAPAAETVAEPAAAEPEVVETEPVVEPAAAEVTAPEVAAEPEPEVVAETEVAEPVVETAPVETPAPAAAAPTVEPTDLSGYSDEEIAATLETTLASLPHVAHFGDQWMSDERVHRLSRGEMRRIKDYIEEQEQPLTDETLVQDILGVRPNSPDYQSAVFGLNYRLSRERDFEFVGTNDQRFWATTNLPPIGTLLRKPNDIGTDYRFLADSGSHETVEHRSVQSVDHVVTFYEYIHGLLPYDEEMQKLVPAPMLEDQRNAVFTFEIPQTYTTYLVELRYPTPNRGGFFLGLDDFYFESLVPGAIISISATENDGHYKIEFLNAGEQSDRLLELDDKRSPRYHFRPTTYSCAVDEAWLINEDRFPKLGSEKPLADKVRRRNDALLAATFERIGMDDGNGGLLASFEDLLAAVNIERPFSEALLREVLEEDERVSGDDANGYTYDTSA
ncbi:MAG TPA: hypothetical protein VKZ61_14000 [Thermomicrobiales bacterium]|nr:hypothetical protein [Thermomicrobiales bacterium]